MQGCELGCMCTISLALGPPPGPPPLGPPARTILGRFEFFTEGGVWRAKCQYDKLWPMGYCIASTGPTVLNDKGVVGGPIVPALCAATRE